MKTVTISLASKTIAFCVLALASLGPALAKRMPAPPPPAVVAHGVRYVVPHIDPWVGTVQAWSVKTGKPLWAKTIYRTPRNSGLESDVQWVFITQLQVRGRRLWITTERGQKYVLNLNTHRVRKWGR